MHEMELRRIASDRIAECLERAAAGRRRRAPRPGRSRGVDRSVPLRARALSTMGRACRSFFGILRRLWLAGLAVEEARYAAMHPWEREGPLRWIGRGRHARLVGRDLPAVDGRPAEGRMS